MEHRLDIANWRELTDARTALIGQLDQVAAKIADISADHRCVRELTDRGVCDTLLCNVRGVIAEANKEVGWKLRVIHHRLARLDRIEADLRREEEQARLAAIASLESPAPSPSSQAPQLKGGL